MYVTTILSRRERHLAKSLTKEELTEKIEYCTSMAIKYLSLDSRQANKYWDAVSYYKDLRSKK